MDKNIVAIEIDGEISTGEVVNGICEVGQYATIILRDENGMPIWQYGTVVEVISSENNV